MNNQVWDNNTNTAPLKNIKHIRDLVEYANVKI